MAAANHVVPGMLATTPETMKNTTTAMIQAAIRTPQPGDRLIVGFP